MSFMQRSAKHFLVIKAAREIKKEIEKAGLDKLKILAEASISIVGTYLRGCSEQQKAQYRRDLNALLQMGVTPEMILEEIVRQMTELSPIMEGKVSYKQREIRNLEAFLRGE
jgi:uncharacterized protein YutE (UPF0331/DUF86 family)